GKRRRGSAEGTPADMAVRHETARMRLRVCARSRSGGMQSDAQGNSFRLPQLESVTLRVHCPTKAAVVVVFNTILHPHPCRAELSEQGVKIAHPVVHQERGRTGTEVGRVGGGG